MCQLSGMVQIWQAELSGNLPSSFFWSLELLMIDFFQWYWGQMYYYIEKRERNSRHICYAISGICD